MCGNHQNRKCAECIARRLRLALVTFSLGEIAGNSWSGCSRLSRRRHVRYRQRVVLEMHFQIHDLPLIPILQFMKSYLVPIELTLGLAAILILGGCAAGEIHRVSGGNPAAEGKSPKLKKPAALYVGTIDMTTGEQRNVKPEDLTIIHDKVEKGLLERLPDLAPTSKYKGTEATGWLITARVSTLNLGSASARWLVGAGLGQAKESFIFEVYDLSLSKTTPIHRFESYADSGSGFGDGGVLAEAGDSDHTGRNTARLCREARNEIAKLFEN